jgi:accessory gene regulator B
MMATITDGIVRFLIKQGSICENEKEIYHFGVEQLLLFIINIATTAFIGMLVDMLWQSILFMLGYIPLRKFAGGYHAKTPMHCYFMSATLTACALWSIKLVKVSVLLMGATWLMSTMIIFLKGPTASINKALTDRERILFRKVMLIITRIDSFMIWIMIFFSCYTSAKCLLEAMIITAFFLVMPVKRTE